MLIFIICCLMTNIIDAARMESCDNCHSYDDCVQNCASCTAESFAHSWTAAKGICTALNGVNTYCAIARTHDVWNYLYRCCTDYGLLGVHGCTPPPTPHPTPVPVYIPSDCNWHCYADRYQGLEDAYGDDYAALENHWNVNGRDEGRNCRCDIDNFVGGDGFIEIGDFRIGKYDGVHFSISSKAGYTAMVFRRSDGTVHPGPRVPASSFTLWDRPLLDDIINVEIKHKAIVFGADEWCLGYSTMNEDYQHHLSLAAQGITLRIWREDGNAYNGPRSDYNCFFDVDNGNKDVIINKDVFGRTYIQFNDMFRIGDTGTNAQGQHHLSVSSKQTAELYRDDGVNAQGPINGWAPNGDEWAPYTQAAAKVDLFNFDAVTHYGEIGKGMVSLIRMYIIYIVIGFVVLNILFISCYWIWKTYKEKNTKYTKVANDDQDVNSAE